MSLVVIEGLDGSGKSTQINLLKEHLKRSSVSFRYLHFPRLEEGVFGRLVARFLRGEMGANDRVDPYLVALIFAGDRADAAGQIREWTEAGQFVVLDRYVYSNIAFQCAKLDDPGERLTLREWILDLEYGYHRIPRPDLNLFLNVPMEFIRNQLNGQRQGEDRTYLRGEKDIHETNLDFQEKVRKEYLSLREDMEDLVLIECMDPSGGIRSPEEISEMIVNKLEYRDEVI